MDPLGEGAVYRWDEPLIETQIRIFPVFQLVTGGDPVGGSDVRAAPATAAQRRGPAVRAGYRPLPRDGAAVVG